MSEEFLVEFRDTRGMRDVSRPIEQASASSIEAFQSAMATVAKVAEKTAETIKAIKITERPDNVEMTFGLKLTSDARAFIVNAGIESQIEVKLTWTQTKDVPTKPK